MKNKLTKMVASFNTLDNGVTEIFIYDVISDKKSFNYYTLEDGNEFTPTEMINSITNATNNILVRINSSGGDIFAAETIASIITDNRNKGKTIYCQIDGICASAAVRIATACEKIIIAKSAYIMIHDPMCVLYGDYNKTQLDKLSNALEVLKSGIINAYLDKTNLSADEISKMMKEETWFTGAQAILIGFADELLDIDISFDLMEDKTLAVNNRQFSFVAYRNVPEFIKEKLKQEGEKPHMKNFADFKNAYPDIANKVISEATDKGAEIERERIKAIDELYNKVSLEVINKAKYETFENAETVAFNAFKNGDFINQSMINGLEDDAFEVNKIGAESGLQNSTATQKEREKQEIKNAMSAIYK